jgi:hypothetical protein
MAKLAFTKLGLKPNNDVVNIYFNEQTIEVKQYLPTDKKLDIITNVLELSHDSNNFSNPVKVGVYTALEVIDKYTNISFTDKQKEDVLKLYDLLNGNGVIAAVVNAIPEAEYNELLAGIAETIESVYKFQNSVLGILDTIGKDYSNLKLDAEGIQKALGDPENLGLLKDIMTKLG